MPHCFNTGIVSQFCYYVATVSTVSPTPVLDKCKTYNHLFQVNVVLTLTQSANINHGSADHTNMTTDNPERDQFLSADATQGGLEVLPGSYFEDSNSTCPMCYETDVSDCRDPTIVKTPCGHVYHYICLETWLRSLGQRASTCPYCRHELYGSVPVVASAQEMADRTESYMLLLEVTADAVENFAADLRDDDGLPTLERLRRHLQMLIDLIEVEEHNRAYQLILDL